VHLDDLLRRQAGVLSRAQALSCGIASRTLSRRVAEGGWRVLLPGIYLVGGHRTTDETRIRAAWLWLGPEALVSGPAAAHWHGMLAGPSRMIDVTIPPQSPFGPWTLDLAFPALRVAVEVDGWAWHVARDRFVNDRAKGNELVVAGWILLRFTWTDLTEHPDRCSAILRSTLARAA
jgi:very-short-patch-repair endonuclease